MATFKNLDREKKQKMRITIISTYSWLNKGDAAIVLGTAHALRQVHPQAEITVVSMTPRVDLAPYAHKQIGVVSGPFGYIYAPGRSLFYRMTLFVLHSLLMLAGLLVVRYQRAAQLHWLPSQTRALVQKIADADLIIGVGGGYWTDNSRKAIYFHLWQTIGVLIAKRPMVTLGVSLGPFRSRWRSRLVGRVLNHVAAIIVREEESLAVARDMGIRPEILHRYADMAFALAPTTQQQTSAARPDAPLRIGVTARRYLFPHTADPAQAQAAYERTLATALDQLIARTNAEVIFLPQVIGPDNDNDRLVQRRIVNLLQDKRQVTLLENNFSPNELIEQISALDFVIATRFHSAIFTLLAHVPVVAIAYEHKTTGIMQLLGLSQWVIPIEQVTAADILERCAILLRERTTVRQQIAQGVQQMNQQAVASATFSLTFASPRVPAYPAGAKSSNGLEQRPTAEEALRKATQI